ncbi:hypothetical protein [Ferrimicrobium sp.]|uniref:hypothetical protein n=1 Tax=Ferrimicrobium sp. TaxID=2926050 RepID=UPI00262CF719|nr:hypothetical protein [Ferrimicrobium sp.]
MEDLRERLEREMVKLRRSGVIPPSLEARMGEVMNELKPRLRFDSIKDRLFNLEATSYIDTAVPTASQKPGVSYLKRTIKAGIGWYLTYITQQINNFTFETVGLLNALELRLVEQEQRLDRIAPHLALGQAFGRFPANALTEEAALEALTRSPIDQPILVAAAEQDQLLKRLTIGVPDLAYGQIEDPVLADRAATEGLDIRNSSLLWHLEHCADASLGGIVLRGVELECSPIWFKRAALAEARRIVIDGGPILLIHHEPSILATARELNAIAALRGGPITAMAWTLLCREAGLTTATQMIDVDTALTRLDR